MLGVVLPALWLPFCAMIYAPSYVFSQRGHLLPIAMATDMVAIGSYVWALALAVPAGLFLQRRQVSSLFAVGGGVIVSVGAFYFLLLFFWFVTGADFFGVVLADPFARVPFARLIAPLVVAGLAGLTLLVAANRNRG